MDLSECSDVPQSLQKYDLSAPLYLEFWTAGRSERLRKQTSPYFKFLYLVFSFRFLILYSYLI